MKCEFFVLPCAAQLFARPYLDWTLDPQASPGYYPPRCGNNAVRRVHDVEFWACRRHAEEYEATAKIARRVILDAGDDI